PHHIPTDIIRYLLAGSLAVSITFMGLIEMLLKKEEHVWGSLKTSVSLKFLASGLIVIVGSFGHLLHAIHLLCLMFGALMVPVIYEIYVWFKVKTYAPVEHNEG
ncbi:MAG TPA: hypothetical protein VIJ46_04145, partial [Rhabdochlamydiaceae bacterium]